MTAKPTPVEVFGVRSDGELMPLRSGSARYAEPARAETRTSSVDSDRVWILGPLNDVPDDERSGSASYQARRATHPGGYRDRPTRAGGREDVVAPVPVLPGRASRALHTGELFDDPLPGLSVNVDSLEVGAHGSSWDATVTWGRIRRRTRPATLRAYPSRSANLTVLELVPTRSRLIHTRAFVRAGVPAIATLCSRINRAAGNRPSSPASTLTSPE
ncbi:MAG: hypothetical protein OES24_01655 [Acidimicrobiia bacterium]|nr:hypothetical protein [Acidimicrobiia bacterium]